MDHPVDSGGPDGAAEWGAGLRLWADVKENKVMRTPSISFSDFKGATGSHPGRDPVVATPLPLLGSPPRRCQPRGLRQDGLGGASWV